MDHHNILFKVCRCASIVCYSVSFIPPVFSTDNKTAECFQGVWMLIFGGMFSNSNTLFLVWLANPIFIYLQFRYSQPPSRGMRISAYLAVVFGALFLIFGKMVVNEGGHLHPIVAYHLGYWLWEASMILLALAITTKSLLSH